MSQIRQESSARVGSDAAVRVGDTRTQRWRRNLWRFVRRQPIGAASALVIVIMLLAAIFAELVAPYHYNDLSAGTALTGPSANNWFGTDQFGRDLFSRIVYGARISLYIGFITTVVGTVIAVAIGAISGYYGGVIDYVTQRIVDAFQAIPPLILLFGIVVVLGPSITNIIIALVLRQSLTLSRVVRGAVLGVRSTAFIESARAIGASNARIISLHVIPNIIPTAIVLASTSLGGIIVAEATLSFLGYGVPPPEPTWGGLMSNEGRPFMIVAPWLLIYPTVVLSIVVFAMNMLGDALRDELDPRMRGS